jgi:hypothetical protein
MSPRSKPGSSDATDKHKTLAPIAGERCRSTAGGCASPIPRAARQPATEEVTSGAAVVRYFSAPLTEGLQLLPSGASQALQQGMRMCVKARWSVESFENGQQGPEKGHGVLHTEKRQRGNLATLA